MEQENHTARDGKRYRIRYRGPKQSIRQEHGALRVLDSVDHFFRVVEEGKQRPEYLIVVLILSSVYDLYKAETKRDLHKDEDVRIQLCLAKLKKMLDRGIELSKAGKTGQMEAALTVGQDELREHLRTGKHGYTYQ